MGGVSREITWGDEPRPPPPGRVGLPFGQADLFCIDGSGVKQIFLSLLRDLVTQLMYRDAIITVRGTKGCSPPRLLLAFRPGVALPRCWGSRLRGESGQPGV